MKSYIWMISLLIISCRQDDEVIINKNNVLAGVISKDMIYNDFEPDIIIDTLPVSEPYGTEINSLDVDLNNDRISDLRLRTISFTSNFDYGFISDLIRFNTQFNQFSINTAVLNYNLDGPFYQSYNCFGIPKKLKYNDKINLSSGMWTTQDTLYNGLPLRIIVLGLASKGTDNTDIYQIYGNDNWSNTSNGYIGIRFVQGNDTLYGWVRMSIIGYSKIVLHDCAFQRK